MRIALILILVFINFSCSIRSIKYDRINILSKYYKNYTILLDDEKIDLQSFYLDKSNIKSIIVYKDLKELVITQKANVKFLQLKNLEIDSLFIEVKSFNRKKIDLVVIDGVPIADSVSDKINIDPNIIKSIKTISQKTLNTELYGKNHEGDILLISTE